MARTVPDFRRAGKAFAAPAEAAQAGEATIADQVERTKICSALRDAGLMLEPVPDRDRAWRYKVTPLPTPSREEVQTDEQVRPVVELFANCDAWTAKEWMQRLVNAVNLRDQAVRDGNYLAFETYNNIASSTASRIARECADEIFAALKAAGPSAQQCVSEAARIAFCALDLADRLIERAYGTDAPREWAEEYQAVAKARRIEAALSPENGGA